VVKTLPLPGKLERVIQSLPRGQRRVARILARGAGYRQAAISRGLQLGTVKNYMREIRLRRPEAYRAVMEFRAQQLAERHAEAVSRREERTREWCFSQAKRRYRGTGEVVIQVGSGYHIIRLGRPDTAWNLAQYGLKVP
jgi:hypothetical protein